jgi:hypothetical protein
MKIIPLAFWHSLLFLPGAKLQRYIVQLSH